MSLWNPIYAKSVDPQSESEFPFKPKPMPSLQLHLFLHHVHTPNENLKRRDLTLYMNFEIEYRSLMFVDLKWLLNKGDLKSFMLGSYIRNTSLLLQSPTQIS